MPINKLLTYLAFAIALIAVLILATGLLYGIWTAHDPHMLMHELENRVVATAYHTALIVLAAAGVVYLSRKNK